MFLDGNSKKLAKFLKIKSARKKNVEIVDLVKGFPTHIWSKKIGLNTDENGPVKVCDRKNGAKVAK